MTEAAPVEGVRRIELAILLIGATGIAFEIALVRAFSIAQWHHFAYMIISMALLGFAVSGTVLGLLGDAGRERFTRFLRGGALLLAIALVGCYEIVAFAVPALLRSAGGPMTSEPVSSH